MSNNVTDLSGIAALAAWEDAPFRFKDDAIHGMRYLDEHMPDWMGRGIDLDTMQMAHCDSCLMAQISEGGDYESGLREVGLIDFDDDDLDNSNDPGIGLGFSIGSYFDDKIWWELDNVWYTLIIGRCVGFALSGRIIP